MVYTLFKSRGGSKGAMPRARQDQDKQGYLSGRIDGKAQTDGHQKPDREL